MKRLLVTFSALLVVGALGACKSNPYDGMPPVTSTIQTAPTPSPSPTPTPVPTPTPTPAPTFSLDAPDEMQFTAGTQGQFIVRGSVPPPGTAQISFKNLPSGATYDATTQKLSWTPSASQVNTYVVTITLTSSADPVSAVTKDSVMVVSAAGPLMTRIATQMLGAPTDGTVQFSFSASDLTMSQFPIWKVQSGHPNLSFKTTQVSDGYFPQTLISGQWAPQAGEKQLEIWACTDSSCATRQINIENGLTLKDPATGAVTQLGGDQ